MIDLHIHSTYSDGTDNVKTILQKAENKKLEYISITDHDNCKAYSELKKINIPDYYTGKIISGIEIKCSYQKRLIELLGYCIDTDKMQQWADIYYKDKTRKILQQKYFDILHEKCKKLKLIVNTKENIKFDANKDWASLVIFNELKLHKENKEKLPEDMLESFNTFSKKYCGDVNNIFYMDKTKDYPSLEEAITVIKECGGYIFLPHIFIYQWVEDKEKFLFTILENYPIDGIECIHSEFKQKEIEYLIKLCDQKGYWKSGGSDYHGANKKEIQMGLGKGNLKIKKDLITDWIKNKIELSNI